MMPVGTQGWLKTTEKGLERLRAEKVIAKNGFAFMRFVRLVCNRSSRKIMKGARMKKQFLPFASYFSHFFHFYILPESV
jgi:hypothetical protein